MIRSSFGLVIYPARQVYQWRLLRLHSPREMKLAQRREPNIRPILPLIPEERNSHLPAPILRKRIPDENKKTRTMEYCYSTPFISVLVLALIAWASFYLADVVILFLMNLKRALGDEINDLLAGGRFEEDSLEDFDDSNYPMG